MVSRLAREVLGGLCEMGMCLLRVSGNAMCVMRRDAGVLETPATGAGTQVKRMELMSR